MKRPALPRSSLGTSQRADMDFLDLTLSTAAENVALDEALARRSRRCVAPA